MPDYFTLDELNALPDMPDFDDAAYEAAGDYIEGIIEREVGTSFVPRVVTNEIHNGGCGPIVLRSAYVQSVDSVSIGGVVSTDSILAQNGVLYRMAGNYPVQWYPGFGNVSVTYTAGYSTVPPADVKQAALYGARAWLLANSEFAGMDARRTSISTDMGVVSYVVAGENRPTGYPEVDAVILGWKRRLDAFGFA